MSLKINELNDSRCLPNSSEAVKLEGYSEGVDKHLSKVTLPCFRNNDPKVILVFESNQQKLQEPKVLVSHHLQISMSQIKTLFPSRSWPKGHLSGVTGGL
jgi:hypothetical protein